VSYHLFSIAEQIFFRVGHLATLLKKKKKRKKDVSAQQPQKPTNK
jgi:hypothetical protein